MSDQPLQPTKQDILKELDDAREKTRAVLNRVKPNVEIYPTWTIKQVLAHLSGWDEACIASIEALLNHDEGNMPALRGADFYNAQSVETRQTLDYEQVRRECEVTRDQLKQALNRVPEEDLQAIVAMPWGGKTPLSTLVRAFARHEAEHAVEISGLVDAAEAAHQQAES